MAASYENTYVMNVSAETLRAIILNPAFSSKLNVEFKSENPTATGMWFRFHHGVTFTSWGEKITITLNRMGDNATQMILHSECGMPTQVVDWGKNRQVVCNIFEYIEAAVASTGAPAAQPFAAPAAQPPISQPPISQPPMTQPPIGQPPAAQPFPENPFSQAPVAQPPVAQPPVAQPPVQTGPKFCTRCGKPVPAVGNFCTSCGAKINR